MNRRESDLDITLPKATLLIGVVLVLLGLGLPAAADESALTDGRDVVLAGIYSDKWQSGADIAALGEATGKRVSLVGTFHHLWESEHGVPDNTDWQLEQAWSAQATPVANVEVAISAYDLAAGGYDSAIRKWALRVKGWLERGEGRSLLIAPLQEMNSNWVVYGQDPGNFQSAFRKFVDIFRSEGIDETMVRWVFAPNAWSVGPHQMAEYYPGDEVADFVGISVYNFGATIGRWTGLADSGMAALANVRSFAPNKPYLITQVGSSTAGGDRDSWLRELFALTASDPNVVGLIYFNFIKETDWKVWDGLTPAAGWNDGMQMEGTEYRWPLTTWFQEGPIPFTPYRGRFVDDETLVSEADIDWLANRGILNGCGPERFCPSQGVTRGEAAAFLARALHLPLADSDRFADDNGLPYEADINALAQAGISQGCAPDAFCPHDLVSRGQVAALLLEALDLPAQANVQFVDSTDSPYLIAINSVVAAGISQGCGVDQFCPRDAVNREQMALFLRRGLEMRLVDTCVPIRIGARTIC
ncbi:MAG: S-layer homology domain-containing protein [Acidimicrobiia bacterium]|nr:S-layer homology domain-containing protein [Acidimicrobiia bacterium]MDQ3500461.1 S-layer homology domain-containing protein [Actinomycetota bacterium]